MIPKQQLPSCPHFPRCGGCQTLDKSYEVQLREKRERLEKLFAFARLPSIPGVIPSPQVYNYRHKVQLPFGVKKSGRSSTLLLGCYGCDSHDVVDQYACLVQDAGLSKIAWAVRDWARHTGLPAYNEKTGGGFWRHVLLRKGAGTGEVLVGLVTSGGRPTGSRNLANSLLESVRKAGAPAIVGIVQNVNTRRTNVVLGEQEFVWWGRPFLFEKLGKFRFAVGLQTFFQVNPFQTPALYGEVLKWIRGGPAVLECYCGVGSISLWVSAKSRVVAGIDENGASIAAAKRAALANGVRNVRFMRDTAEDALARMAGEGYEVAIFDPPRKGLEPSMTGALLKSSLGRIIYVSCNPETLARDVQALARKWRLVSLQGVDMFPHTEHLECVAILDSIA